MREKLPEIERQLEIGIRQEAIVSEINQSGGFDTTLANFRNELVRARRWQAGKEVSAPPLPKPAKPASSAPGVPSMPKVEGGSYVYPGTPKDDSDVI